MWTGKNKDTINWDGTLEAGRFVGDGSQLTGISAGSETDPVWVAAKPTYDNHISSTAIHFTSNALWTAVDLNTAKTTYDDATLVAACVASTALNTAKVSYTDAVIVAANTASCAVVDPHIADNTIHFTSDALWTAVNINTGKTTYDDAALVAACVASTAINTAKVSYTDAAVVTANTASCALVDPHIADSSDPHGALLTQTHITLSGVASCAQVNITADNTTASVAIVRNIILGTDETPPTASNYPTGTIYCQYTA